MFQISLHLEMRRLGECQSDQRLKGIRISGGQGFCNFLLETIYKTLVLLKVILFYFFGLITKGLFGTIFHSSGLKQNQGTIS